jgi:putative FmdB family regulatory protein
MPTYEYRCKDCGHELEAVQSFDDDALTECPACGGDQLKKRFGAVGISFKGSGFYKNDSRTSSGSSKKESSTSESSGSEASTSSGSDSSSGSDASTSTATSSSSDSGSKSKTPATT